MQTSLTDSGYKSSFLGKFVQTFLSKNLPKKFKRMIYISSLTAVLNDIKEPDKALSEQINEIFKIAKYPESVMFSMYIKSLIWNQIDLTDVAKLNDHESIFTEETFNAIVTKIINKAPDWLKYGTLDLIKIDTALVIKNCSMLKMS